MKLLRGLQITVVSLAPSLLFFGALELGARVLEPKGPRTAIDFSGGFNPASQVFVPDPDNPGEMVTNLAKGKTGFQTQRFTREKAKGKLRIAALGESSVYGLHDEFYQLSNSLGVEFINAGGLSYGSDRLTIVAAELIQYSPDLLFIYMGHNEFEEADQYAMIRPHLSRIVEYFHERSALVRLATMAITNRRINRLREEHVRRLEREGPNTDRAWTIEFSASDVEERMKNFRANLAGIIELYQSRKIPVLLSTIPSNLITPELPHPERPAFAEAQLAYKQKRYGEAKKIAREALLRSRGRHQSSDLENGILRELAKTYGLPLLDVEKLITEAEPNGIPGETLFQDHCHLNPKGQLLLANALKVQIQKMKLEPR